MAPKGWPTAEELLGAAFDAEEPGQLRQYLIDRFVRAAGAERAMLSNAAVRVARQDLVNIPLDVGEAARHTFLTANQFPQLRMLLREIIGHGAVVDTGVYH